MSRKEYQIKTFLFLLGIYCFSGLYAQTDSLQTLNDSLFLKGITTGDLPYLEYGPGADRLGGAKMTYLDTAVVLQVVDSLADDYIVQLSKNHKAFIPKANIQLSGVYPKTPYHLTSSWKVDGDAQSDLVSIRLDERLPYKSIQMINPSRIVVDIYGATSNTNWITQRRSATEIKNAYCEQVEDDVFRVIIELKHQQIWGYSIGYKDKSLQISIKRQPTRTALKHLKIAIDAGHGGSNTGAVGVYTRVQEKDCNLQVAKQLEKYLKRRGANVFMTRNGDEELSMTDRTLMLREQNPDLLISIHHNSSSNRSVSGVSTYYRYIGFKPLSVTILNRMLELGLDEFGNVGNFNFALSGPTEYPNCLVEVAFLSNETDEKQVIDPHFQKKTAKKIRKGIIDWLKDNK
ncbi:N-acetylmuramoyl-L-alanine amidase [Mangrovibacterium diazotrophicum]|uniref:N-acetylmuramoyl-L-alanine amidase n=1 Tax=Mangrovibacterium diazotrophicum TaxID=1261403 RepID=A0A419W9P6_9BACT|nr:N-acetylmuramoyl-L-alanine amidase [Mangrovibacterium diazotrophicum]RKD92201.1 N-acetylmuramoyl-L-alanine amidase [Mangrovibacterium diazotrophicum]